MTQDIKKQAEIESKALVAKFRENERVHTEEWDETRYLEKKIQTALLTFTLKQMELIADVLELAKLNLPDSNTFKYCWDECLSDEQDEVKACRSKINGALTAYNQLKESVK